MTDKLQLAHSYVPASRPTYEEWVKQMRISHAAWYYGEGRERADRINSQLGVVDSPSLIQSILGRESDEYLRWKAEKQLNEN